MLIWYPPDLNIMFHRAVDSACRILCVSLGAAPVGEIGDALNSILPSLRFEVATLGSRGAALRTQSAPMPSRSGASSSTVVGRGEEPRVLRTTVKRYGKGSGSAVLTMPLVAPLPVGSPDRPQEMEGVVGAVVGEGGAFADSGPHTGVVSPHGTTAGGGVAPAGGGPGPHDFATRDPSQSGKYDNL